MEKDLEFDAQIEMLASQIYEDLLVQQLNMCIISLASNGTRGKSESKNTQECETGGKQSKQCKQHYWQEP